MTLTTPGRARTTGRTNAMSGSSVVVTCGPRVKFPSLLYLVGMALVVALSSSDTIVPVAASPTRRTPFSSAFSRLPGRSYDSSGDDDDDNGGNGEHNRNSNGFSVQGTGREFDLFDTRADNSNLDPTNDNTDANMDDVHDTEWNDESDTGFPRRSTASAAYQRNNHHNGGYPRAVPAASYTSRRAPPYRRSSTFGSISRDGSTSSNSGVGSNGGSSLPFLQTVQEWWSTTLPHFPKLKCRLEPTTTLKIQKTFRPLGTIIRLGAEFNTQLGVWRFRSSWEDAIIGGKLTLAGKELQLSKSWQLSMGPMEDLVTRLRFRAAVDLSTMKAYARVGFRTERLSPINVLEGFTLQHKFPLDGSKGHIKLGVKAKVALPEPEIEYSTENQRSLVGMGDIDVNVEELNLLLDY